MMYWLGAIQHNDWGDKIEADVQCEVNEVVLPNDVNDEITDGPHGGDETVFYSIDDELVEETLCLDKDRILTVVAELGHLG
jgi:hypothetical protein